MKEKFRQRYFLLLLLAMASGCADNETAKENVVATQPTATSSQVAPAASSGNTQICPVPLRGYANIPGYQPGRVDPSLSQKAVEIISPTVGNGGPVFHEGLTQQPIRFCGTAKDNIAKVKLFSTGAYTYEQQPPVPADPELPIGEDSVENGIWFVDYDFRDGPGKRNIVAKGYDASDKLVETAVPIIVSIADVNPG
jgi:hypothetical protein